MTLEIDVKNPRTGTVDYRIARLSETDFDTVCQELRSGQKTWSKAGLEARVKVLLQWADAIEVNANLIGSAEALDTGRQRLSHEVPHMVVGSIRDWCAKAPHIFESAQRTGTSVINANVVFETQLVPYGLVGFITPWNHPFLLSMIDAIPALLAGCAAVIKPSEIAPRFIEPVMETVRQFPELAAVLRYVAGDGATGQALIQRVDAVCFTGSIKTGRLVAEACARRLIPAFLELGGKDPAIVTEHADLERAATSVLRGSVFAMGQICFSVERVYVHESVYDDFVALLAGKSQALELAYPDPAHGDLGPFILASQAAIVDSHIDDAVSQGAKIVTGGRSENLGGGHYMRATVISDVTHDMKLMTEETFGPVTPVMKYRTEDEAVALANDSVYGLSAAVFAGGEEEAMRIGQQIDAGAVALQDAAITIYILRDAEKMSFKSSGIGGSRMGPNALLRFVLRKALVTNRGGVADLRDLAEHRR
ncbi:aldehyde dehydrogenase family protein [Pseudomonas yamanorum]|uniref:aldehyde dehydrogenase family protein n=1 Tax=Pseudomonas yamanorum TaxID=515393 RepID=UPI0015A1D6C5|nr:aldehyde dehydrogenase family protein [Pseudomonas yamanorum]